MIIFSVSSSQWPPREANVLLQWHCVIWRASLLAAFQAPGCYFAVFHEHILRSGTAFWK